MRLVICVLASALIGGVAQAADTARTAASADLLQKLRDAYGEPVYAYPINAVIEATPGQEFYSEVYVRNVKGFELERPFDSSMAGSMGFPFAFSIDEKMLSEIPKRRNGDWTYYEPVNQKFTASHGLLGSVLADGDSVGLRIDGKGRREWYVDNSNHNGGLNTMWTRKVKAKDPAQNEVAVASREPTGLAIQQLMFLGVDNGRVRIRHEQIFPNRDDTRDEYTFDIGPDGRAVGAVRGSEFVIETGPLKSRITVLKPMTSSSGRQAPSL